MRPPLTRKAKSSGVSKLSSEWTILPSAEDVVKDIGVHTMVQRVEVVSIDSTTGKVERVATGYRGCTNKKACNYYHLATEDDGSCVLPPALHDCQGRCTVEKDCEGTCGGSVEFDNCGVCGGDGQSCVIKPCAYFELHAIKKSQYNISECQVSTGLEAGATCNITCVEGMQGEPGVFSCPEENTDAHQQLVGKLPTCTFKDEMAKFDPGANDNDIKCLNIEKV